MPDLWSVLHTIDSKNARKIRKLKHSQHSEGIAKLTLIDVLIISVKVLMRFKIKNAYLTNIIY